MLLSYYFPPTAAGKSINTHQSSPTDALLTFATFYLQPNYPLSRLLITLVYHRAHFVVDKIALVFPTLLNVSHDALSFPQVQPVRCHHTQSITAKNVSYIIQCNCCHLQNIGQTKRRVKYKFNEHRRSVDKTDTKSEPTTVAGHFLSHPNRHCHTVMQLIPLELIHSSRDSIRKARESYLKDLAGTLEDES